MKKSLHPMLWVAMVIAVLAAGTLPLEADRTGVSPTSRFRQPVPQIANQVLDLLDSEVILDAEAEQLVWESARFDTSRFNRIGLRFSAETEGGAVTCAVCWQYAPDDECLTSVPAITLGRPTLRYQIMPGNFGRIRPDLPIPDPGVEPRREDGVPDLYVQNPRQRYPLGVWFPQDVDFAEVRGLGAKVRCTMDVFQVLGDDPSLRDEYPTQQQAVTLTDVKVLLRRD